MDQPIINNPYCEPTKYWHFGEGYPEKREGRRTAGYFLATRSESVKGPVAAEAFVDLPLINRIRERVKKWRELNYPGVTRTTRILLDYWKFENREEQNRRRLFFCQLEAVESIIWLVEASDAEKQGIDLTKDEPVDAESLARGYASLLRYACKMATGSGKTVVMAMLIAWSVLNKLQNKQDKRFSDAIFVVAPNLTVKERLQVLLPSNPSNFFENFDLLPRPLLSFLSQAKVEVVNWQALAEDQDPKRSVIRRGKESESAFAKRVLRNLGDKKNILVINDEAHHAYRPALRELGSKQETLVPKEETEISASELKEREEEAEEATVWVNALDKINFARGINFCLDMSATPFYIKGSGHSEGEPFPWLVSDFGLVDAIESGIVKIPRIPVDDNSGQPIPKYFRLWKEIMLKLPSSEREAPHRKAKPESVMREAEGALATLASQWEKTFKEFREKKYPVPPAMIVVCANTDLAKLMFDHISSGKVMPDLENTENRPNNTLHIDNKQLEEAEKQVEATKEMTASERLRKMVSTVGKQGEMGERIRCVVSVAMLNEGWDAQNITQILGLRAFSSQLLCEQVVGRGLRRTNYDDLSVPEYVDVYGIPFEVIPVQRGSLKATFPINVPTLVRALPERKRKYEIRFPRVEGYVFDVKYKIKADVDKIPRLHIDPTKEPTEIVTKDAVVMKIGRPDRLGPGEAVLQNRNPFHAAHRLQTTIYEITAEVTDKLKASASRQILFPQVKDIVWQYFENRVTVKKDAVIEEAYLKRYKDLIVSRICDAIRPDTEAGEAPILPRIERYRAEGSTSEVMFRTVKDTYATEKSHINYVVADSGWEHQYAYDFEKNPNVLAYAKNDHLDFTIPYEYEGVDRSYYPDFIIRLKTVEGYVINVILEVKGFESEKDRAKRPAAERWVEAVNYNGNYGVWKYVFCKGRTIADAALSKLHNTPLTNTEKEHAIKTDVVPSKLTSDQ